jgi:hypothetical protein
VALSHTLLVGLRVYTSVNNLELVQDTIRRHGLGAVRQGAKQSTGPGPVLFEGTGHKPKTAVKLARQPGPGLGPVEVVVLVQVSQQGKRHAGRTVGRVWVQFLHLAGCANTGHCVAVAYCRGEAPQDRITMWGAQQQRPKRRAPR